MFHFIRLMRPLNLAIIAFTMYVMKIFVIEALIGEPELYQIDKNLNLNFFLLVLMTILIAAAGNIINDYFDVKADRINRPNKIIIGKHVKKRWAIVSNWGFNIIALVIGSYLGWFYQNWTFFILPIATSTLLWWYSASLKKKWLVGNLLVSFLTALTPLICVLPFYKSINLIPDAIKVRSIGIIVIHSLLFLFSIFAFLTNLSREIYKDIIDIEGDKKIRANTIAQINGISKANSIALVINLIILISISIFTVEFLTIVHESNSLYIGTTLLLLVLSTLSISLISSIRNKNPKDFKFQSNCMKIVMLLGLLYPILISL